MPRYTHLVCTVNKLNSAHQMGPCMPFAAIKQQLTVLHGSRPHTRSPFEALRGTSRPPCAVVVQRR